MFRGQRAWLRVSPFLEHEMSGKAWRGTAEAAAIPGVSKPALLYRIEWRTDGPSPVPVSAEVLTLVTDPPASWERFLRTAPDLPADWFSDLRTSLRALRAYSTDRQFPVHDPEEYGYLLGATYRRPVPADCVPAFGTEHIDLNWHQIQRMVMARQLLKGLFSPADLRILKPASNETGRQANESGGPLSCPGCPVHAGYSRRFRTPVLNRC